MLAQTGEISATQHSAVRRASLGLQRRARGREISVPRCSAQLIGDELVQTWPGGLGTALPGSGDSSHKSR